MRNVKLQIQMSVNGYIAGPDNEMDWLEWNWGDDIKNYISKITEPIDTILLGRKLAEGFIPHWQSAAENPETANDFCHKMVNTPKIVFSKTIKNQENWKNTIVNNNNISEEIEKLKVENGGDIIVYGGGNFVSSLIKNGLIDDYFLFINPSAISKGMPVFEELNKPKQLQLVSATPFACGITALHYKNNAH